MRLVAGDRSGDLGAGLRDLSGPAAHRRILRGCGRRTRHGAFGDLIRTGVQEATAMFPGPVARHGIGRCER